MKRHNNRLAFALVLGLTGCVHDAFEDARQADTAEAYQQFLRDHPDEHGSEQARARLASKRFAEARQAHSVLAYKRFLEDFPNAEEAPDALKLLEGLRFNAAEQAGTAVAYRDFLRDHPDGAHAAQARAALEAAEWKDAQASTGSAPMKAFVARFPDSPHRAEAERIADDRAFAEAQHQGNAGVADYLEHANSGGHRDEARALLLAEEAEALATGGDLVGAFQLAQRVTGPAGEALQQKLAERELEEVASALEPAPLKALAERRPQVKARALELARELERDPKTAKALRAQVAHLDPLEFGRPIDELERALEAPDPRDRWLAAEELGRLGAMDAFDKLLDVASDSRFEEIRLRAFDSLELLAGRLGPEAMVVEGRRRLEKLRKMASGPRLYLKVALVEELSGQRAEAMADYQRALRGDAEDLLALRRLQVLERPGFGRAVISRRLATTVEEQGKSRTSGDTGDPPLLAARWFCGAQHDAQAAVDALQKLPPETTRDAPEDIPAFQQRAAAALAMARARLADFEDAARAEQPRFVGCEVDDVLPRLADGIHARLAAIDALAHAKTPLAAHPLRHAARRDPSPEVRAAAQKALDGLKIAAAAR